MTSNMYRRRPPMVEAHRWTAGDAQGRSLAKWAGGTYRPANEGGSAVISMPFRGDRIFALPGDWIVLGNNEFYPMKHGDFLAAYERLQ